MVGWKDLQDEMRFSPQVVPCLTLGSPVFFRSDREFRCLLGTQVLSFGDAGRLIYPGEVDISSLKSTSSISYT